MSRRSRPWRSCVSSITTATGLVLSVGKTMSRGSPDANSTMRCELRMRPRERCWHVLVVSTVLATRTTLTKTQHSCFAGWDPCVARQMGVLIQYACATRASVWPLYCVIDERTASHLPSASAAPGLRAVRVSQVCQVSRLVICGTIRVTRATSTTHQRLGPYSMWYLCGESLAMNLHPLPYTHPRR